jgi:hypothetical protein
MCTDYMQYQNILYDWSILEFWYPQRVSDPLSHGYNGMSVVTTI